MTSARIQHKVSDKGIALIEHFEGIYLRAYLCTSGKPTIGIGTTVYPDSRMVKLGDEITREQAYEYFRHDLAQFDKDVNMLVTSDISQCQHDALVSFSYNVGSDIDDDRIPEGLGDSTLLNKVNADPNDPAISAEFVKWIRSKGVKKPGLLRRRRAEAWLYFNDELKFYF